MKKLINDPNMVARETIEELALANPHTLKKIEGAMAVARRDAPVAGKVAVVTGGGSGHEPLFAGYVGRGLADASVAGNIFASPPPMPIVTTARQIHSGRGILLLYGNYSGDILNFDAAAEELTADGIEVMTVRIADDVASAPRENRSQRRGIAGDIFVVKTTCAAAEEGLDLPAVAAVAEKANENTASMAVALTSCIIPASGKPIFAFPTTKWNWEWGSRRARRRARINPPRPRGRGVSGPPHPRGFAHSFRRGGGRAH